MKDWKLTDVYFTDFSGRPLPPSSSITRQGDSYRVCFTQPNYNGDYIRATARFTQKGTGLTATQVVWGVGGRGKRGVIQELEVLDYWEVHPEALIPETLARRLP